MNNNYLIHWGIKGQRWGHRRFQNPDGTLTPEGRERYGVSPEEKERILKSGNVAKIRSISDDLSNEELRRALDRVDLNTRLSSYGAEKKIDHGKQILDSLQRVTDFANKGYNAYTSVKKVVDLYNGKKNTNSALEDAIKRADKSKLESLIPNMSDEDLRRAATRMENANKLRTEKKKESPFAETVKGMNSDSLKEAFKQMSDEEVQSAAQRYRNVSTIKKFLETGYTDGGGKKKKDDDYED